VPRLSKHRVIKTRRVPNSEHFLFTLEELLVNFVDNDVGGDDDRGLFDALLDEVRDPDFAVEEYSDYEYEIENTTAAVEGATDLDITESGETEDDAWEVERQQHEQQQFDEDRRLQKVPVLSICPDACLLDRRRELDCMLEPVLAWPYFEPSKLSASAKRKKPTLAFVDMGFDSSHRAFVHQSPRFRLEDVIVDTEEEELDNDDLDALREAAGDQWYDADEGEFLSLEFLDDQRGEATIDALWEDADESEDLGEDEVGLLLESNAFDGYLSEVDDDNGIADELPVESELDISGNLYPTSVRYHWSLAREAVELDVGAPKAEDDTDTPAQQVLGLEEEEELDENREPNPLRSRSLYPTAIAYGWKAKGAAEERFALDKTKQEAVPFRQRLKNFWKWSPFRLSLGGRDANEDDRRPVDNQQDDLLASDIRQIEDEFDDMNLGASAILFPGSEAGLNPVRRPPPPPLPQRYQESY